MAHPNHVTLDIEDEEPAEMAPRHNYRGAGEPSPRQPPQFRDRPMGLGDQLQSVIREIRPIVEQARIQTRTNRLSLPIWMPRAIPAPPYTVDPTPRPLSSVAHVNLGANAQTYAVNDRGVPVTHRTQHDVLISNSESSLSEPDQEQEIVSVNPANNNNIHENADNDSQSDDGSQVVDVRATLNILIRYAPFYFILIIKFLYDCREGIFTFLILFVTFTHCNSIIRRENVKQMHRSLSSCLLEMFTTLGIVAIVHYLFGHGKLLYNVVMFPAYSNLNIWELLWLIILTDLIVKIITVNIKMVVTILPSSILPYQKRGRVFLFMESVSQLYRSLLTIQPWIFYLMQSYDDSEKLMGMFLTSVYVICKIIEVTIRLRVFKNAAWSMVQNVDLGTKPSREQLSAAGEACPICHDEYTTPVRLDCSHIFCELCISAWLDREHTCPLCRAKVSDEPTWRDGSTTFDFQLY
ncbi:RING finger and transmembrane domain-containing protein 2 [Spodoptera frugiperda]|uniref:RING finger and transmembrane domain-containing protein 2 n=1 Tax=Spodoptera frugiperda TaxID=7108 RepID=A0A9R0D5P4_SPOFR|nr:RING finger and transmembrane domain-containing protein 2 [Spodoptera frugiperda]